MTARKRSSKPKTSAPAAARPVTSHTVANNVVNQTGVVHNEHTARSIEALSRAAEANARGIEANGKAIEAAAKALVGHGVNIGPAIYLNNTSHSAVLGNEVRSDAFRLNV